MTEPDPPNSPPDLPITALKTIENPFDVFVKGGTSTSANDRMEAAAAEDEKTRRETYDKMVQSNAAAGDLGRMYEQRLGGLSTHASVVLAVKSRRDSTIETYLMCEFIPQADKLVLQMVCYPCVLKGVPSGKAQIQIHEDNRGWSLDTRKLGERKQNPLVGAQGWAAGELWQNPYPPFDMVTLVGTVTTHSWQKCPKCGWEFTIDDSVVFSK